MAEPSIYKMAEREGFEPSIGFSLYTLSRGALSAAQPSLHLLTHCGFIPTIKLAEGVGFEPTNGHPLPVFKTGAFGLSATLPLFMNQALLPTFAGAGKIAWSPDMAMLIISLPPHKKNGPFGPLFHVPKWIRIIDYQLRHSGRKPRHQHPEPCLCHLCSSLQGKPHHALR